MRPDVRRNLCSLVGTAVSRVLCGVTSRGGALSAVAEVAREAEAAWQTAGAAEAAAEDARAEDDEKQLSRPCR